MISIPIFIATILSVAVFSFSIGMILGDEIITSKIRKSLLKVYKYRLDDYYVINGSVDKELK